jgi:hypothetical protein
LAWLDVVTEKDRRGNMVITGLTGRELYDEHRRSS